MLDMNSQPLSHQQVAALYDAHAAQIKAFCQRLLGCPAAAEDATQETFLNILRRNPSIVADANAHRTYIYATARNACYDLIRRRRPAASLDLLAETGDPQADPATMDPRHDPVACTLRGEVREQLTGALAELPPKQAAALVLREAVDLSYEQIAEQLDTNANNVAQLLHRARNTAATSLRVAA